MGRTKEEKLVKYIKVGKLHRIRSLLKNCKKEDVDINAKVDDRGRTALHVSCLLGDDAITRLLLKYGANIQAKDSDGNTPFHLALGYALETTRLSVYTDLILPLLRQFGGEELGGDREALDSLKNNDGVSPSELLVELKEAMRSRREERRKLEEEETRLHEENLRKIKEENEWKRKVRYEVDWEGVSPEDHMKEYHDDDFETYDDWVERIHDERRQKREKRCRQKHKKAEEIRMKDEAAKQRTKWLEAEHQAYQEQIAAKREDARHSTAKAAYETQCEAVFGSSNSTTELTIKYIPWPCDGTAGDCGKLLLRWAKLGEPDDKKYMRSQQVRWHPDRFLQRCGEKLAEADRESILERVKGISQEINDLLSKM